jgi:MFS family permease
MHQRRLFLGCFFALIATAFGFFVRGAILEDWGKQFELSNQQLGYIGGAGLYPFAISIILFSLIVDKIGYGWAMVFAFVGHLASALMTIFADSFVMLYTATFLFALSNGVVEAVINPVVATIYDKNKTHWLNILHAGWPGGLVIGGLLAIAILNFGPKLGNLPGEIWQWQMAIVLLPTVLYGALLMGQKFPVQERVAAGVSYMDMLREFGTASCWIVCFLMVAGIDQIIRVLNETLPAGEAPRSLATYLHAQGLIDWFLGRNIPEALAQVFFYALVGLVPTLVFGVIVRTFGRAMFVFLLFVMFLLATTELGTDGWISNIMQSVFKSNTPDEVDYKTKGWLFLIYTSFIMFVLRFFAGPIVHRISPLGLLALSAALACGGLVWLSLAGNAVVTLFLAATLYGFGKTFFWPTTLGVVSEQYPKGGALMLNAIAGVGMLAVGTLGNPAIGIVQDQTFDQMMQERDKALHAQVVVEKTGLTGLYNALDQEAKGKLPAEQQAVVDQAVGDSKQATLAKIAVLPAVMCVCYLLLIAYFRNKGGYQAQVLTGHAAEDKKFTGGVKGAVEG